MASVSSTSSTSSSLGNTALRGFGGLSSGLDRDSLIEQMTASTTAKITSKKQALTKLQWKQEAYRSISGKILDLQDTYLSYSGTQSLKNSEFFAKSKITTTGNSDYLKYITASGQSDAASRVSVLAVKKMATAATTISRKKTTDDAGAGVTTSLTKDKFENKTVDSSTLPESKLIFGTWDSVNQGFNEGATFTFPTSYKEEGSDKEIEIDYTADPTEVVKHLNKALDASHFLSKDGTGEAGIHFKVVDGKFQINATENISDEGKSYKIKNNGTLSKLGFNADDYTVKEGEDPLDHGISFIKDENSTNKFNETTAKGSGFSDASLDKQSMTEYLTGKSITITYGSQTKTVDLIREGDTVNSFDDFTKLLQNRVNQAFGVKYETDNTTKTETIKPKVEVTLNDKGELSFKPVSADQRIEVSADTLELRNVLGIKENQSNMITRGDSLWENRDKLGFTGYGDSEADKARFNEDLAKFSINGETISGITADTTVDEMLSAINDNKYAGVTATYISNENRFVLTADDKGSGRRIELEGVSDTIFSPEKDKDGKIVDGSQNDGEDAEMLINYNGLQTTLTSTTNTFEIDGLKLTASHTFDTADRTDPNKPVYNAENGVSFNASADVDGVTERVKKFIEDYNALIQETRDQVTTRPDSDYSPLTDDQKNEMNETSIKNWEDKAKEGILFNSTVLKDMSSSMELLFATMMQNGISYDDLESIGVSFSDDYAEGGKIVFDEDKFKSAMETDPDLVSDLFTGDHGIVQTINDTLKPYATRYTYQNGGSYGALIEEAGSEKLSLSVTNNSIYKEIQDMQEAIKNLQTQLSTEQDRYISQFTTMETLISQMNAQSSYLSQLAG